MRQILLERPTLDAGTPFFNVLKNIFYKQRKEISPASDFYLMINGGYFKCQCV